MFPYVGAFAGSVTETAWEPGNGGRRNVFKRVITQVPVGTGINFIGDCARDHGAIHAQALNARARHFAKPT
jgi:hypothetical protein